MNSRFLPRQEWEFVQSRVPIACVDILPIKVGPGNPTIVRSIGLILRNSPGEGERWCLIGGRLLRNESLPEALQRQVRETLGHAVTVEPPPDQQPTYIEQYFTTPRAEGRVDPRQHALGLIYCLPIEGEVQVQGEALRFAWFDTNELPSPDEFGFGQHRSVCICLQRLGAGAELTVREIT